MRQAISMDTDRFKQNFREEAREILTDLESALLELDERLDDPELVGRVFRALHTIKGSGAMFGFERLSAFTHELETAFDQVRGGKHPANAELVELTLEAVDQLRSMLDDDNQSAGNETRKEILVKLRQLADIPHEPRSTEEGKNLDEDAVKGPVRDWEIHFAPGPGLLLNGTNPLLLLEELRELGELSVTAHTDKIPPLTEIEPERCYITWDLKLRASANEHSIRDVFIFVEDECDLRIVPLEGRKLNRPASANADAPRADENSIDDRRSALGGRRASDGNSATTLRVPTAKLDQFVNFVGELVTVQARLSEVAAQRGDAEVIEIAEEVERLTSALRENSMNVRMIPIRETFEKFRRLVHDLGRDLGKCVELVLEGAETELDKTVIEQLSDPLLHLIRNSIDHGIESPELRAAHGKPRAGQVHLSARHAGASVLIGVSDDGAGIDAAAVRERAIEKGLISSEAHLSDAQIYALIFAPGFSTAQQLTNVSGRGVGMDVVRRRVESLRGTVDVNSRPGQGTVVTLRLPLTLAIIDGLLLSVENARFVLPLGNALECIEMTKEDVADANGKQVANVRGELIPYVSLRQHFDIQGERPEIEQIMVVETSQGRCGLAVDQVLGNCQTVIKSLGRFYRNVQAVSGATILGNGSVALILDSERMVEEAARANLRGPRGHPA
ncbi:MAG TPA: chemotaxis protein CheA [Terracidiphilus sp.]|nr:chemotaxis protein CheA [Terracidiphilus sp.]